MTKDPRNIVQRTARFIRRALRVLFNRIVWGAMNRATLWMENVHCAEIPRIDGWLRVRNYGAMEIGKRVVINSGQYYNPIGGDAMCYFVTRHGGRIRIGDDCGISNSTLHAFVAIELEDHVNIGGGCAIYDSDFHPLDASVRRRPGELDYTVSRPVRIESGAWIGGHSIILKGVTIGRNSIVAAGSVVTRSIPADEIWGGNPARRIRKLTEADRIHPSSDARIVTM
jgi:acetyltransferase-like isoleucine patch superfamily enzyme